MIHLQNQYRLQLIIKKKKKHIIPSGLDALLQIGVDALKILIPLNLIDEIRIH